MRRTSRSKCRSCATNGRRSTSSTRAFRRRCGNASTAPAKRPTHPPPGISRSRRRCASRRASSARNSSRPPRRTRRRCSSSRATGARSSAGCAKPITRGTMAIWAASSQRRGRASMRNSGLRSRRCAMRCPRHATRRRRAALALIEEATALAAKAIERDAPAQVKAIQARWQAQAKELTLAQRDERALWEQFRAACDAVFEAREAKRKQEDDHKHEGPSRAGGHLRAARAARARDGQGRAGPAPRACAICRSSGSRRPAPPIPHCAACESRFTKCEERRWRRRWPRAPVPAKRRCGRPGGEGTPVRGARPPAARARGIAADAAAANDAVDRAAGAPRRLGEGDGRPARRGAARPRRRSRGAAHLTRIESGAEARREMLLELEMLLGLECPPELAGAAARAAGETAARALPERRAERHRNGGRAAARMVRAAGRRGRARSAALRTDLRRDGAGALSGGGSAAGRSAARFTTTRSARGPTGNAGATPGPDVRSISLIQHKSGPSCPT